MRKVLFVCHGNICRSAMAEFMFKNRINKLNLNDKFYCESRGVSDEEAGHDLYIDAKECLDYHRIPYTRHFAKKITIQDYEYFDEIYVMERFNLRLMGNILKDDKNKIKMLLDDDIPDPWYYGNFEATYNAIEEGIDKILGA